MKNKSLTEIFKNDPDAYPEGLIFQEGFIDYIEDFAWEDEPKKCSEENRNKIESILRSHESQRKALDYFVQLERKHGKGSQRGLLDTLTENFQVPDSITNLPEWKAVHG